MLAVPNFDLNPVDSDFFKKKLNTKSALQPDSETVPKLYLLTRKYAFGITLKDINID
jgi:hypothetical protein